MKNEDEEINNRENESKKGYGIASFCLAAASVIFLPLSLVISIYGICGSALCSLAALAFYNSQKTRGLFTLVKVARIIAYVTLILSLLLLLGGIIYSATV